MKYCTLGLNLTIVFALPRIPPEDGETDGNGGEDGDDDDPGKWFVDVSFTGGRNVVYSPPKQYNYSSGTEDHPNQPENAFDTIHERSINLLSFYLS